MPISPDHGTVHVVVDDIPVLRELQASGIAGLEEVIALLILHPQGIDLTFPDNNEKEDLK